MFWQLCPSACNIVNINTSANDCIMALYSELNTCNRMALLNFLTNYNKEKCSNKSVIVTKCFLCIFVTLIIFFVCKLRTRKTKVSFILKY